VAWSIAKRPRDARRGTNRKNKNEFLAGNADNESLYTRKKIPRARDAGTSGNRERMTIRTRGCRFTSRTIAPAANFHAASDTGATITIILKTN
jgi:hypothetical protein